MAGFFCLVFTQGLLWVQRYKMQEKDRREGRVGRGGKAEGRREERREEKVSSLMRIRILLWGSTPTSLSSF